MISLPWPKIEIPRFKCISSKKEYIVMYTSKAHGSIEDGGEKSGPKTRINCTLEKYFK